MNHVKLTTNSPERTAAFGAALGRLLRGGDFVALTGPLGAGKTQLVQGLALGLEVPPAEPVVSPTFVLIREYAGRLRLCHIDAYRLHSAEELLALGVEEMNADPQTVVAVEWADRVTDALPANACRLELEHAAPTLRRLTISWNDGARLAQLRAVANELGLSAAVPTGG